MLSCALRRKGRYNVSDSIARSLSWRKAKRKNVVPPAQWSARRHQSSSSNDHDSLTTSGSDKPAPSPSSPVSAHASIAAAIDRITSSMASRSLSQTPLPEHKNPQLPAQDGKQEFEASKPRDLVRKVNTARLPKEIHNHGMDTQSYQGWRNQQLYHKIITSVSEDAVKDSPSSGYGWSRVAPQRSSQRTTFAVTRMLNPYLQPLLVCFYTPGTERRLLPSNSEYRGLGLTLRALYGKQSLLEVHVLNVRVHRISIPPASEILEHVPQEYIFNGARGAAYFWTSLDQLHVGATQVNDAIATPTKIGQVKIRLHESPKGLQRPAAPYQEFSVSVSDDPTSTGELGACELLKVQFEPTPLPQGHFRYSPTVQELYQLDQDNIRLDIHGSSIPMNVQPYTQQARSVLTEWRAVAEISGNVIKKLHGREGLLPASTELESAVSRLHASEHGSFEIWAEIRTSKIVPTTFVRVVSGGGGWGDKRGLIALDPESTPDREMPMEFDPSNLFPGLVLAGQELRFVKVASRRNDPADTASSKDKLEQKQYCVETHGRTTFSFGTTGAMDTREEAVAGYHLRQQSAKTTLIMGHFGAMSPRMKYGSSWQVEGEQIIHSTDLPPYTSFSNNNGLTARNDTFPSSHGDSGTAKTSDDRHARTIDSESPFKFEWEQSYADFDREYGHQRSRTLSSAPSQEGDAFQQEQHLSAKSSNTPRSRPQPYIS